MITMPIPPAELYQAMASASAKAATAAGNAMKSSDYNYSKKTILKGGS